MYRLLFLFFALISFVSVNAQTDGSKRKPKTNSSAPARTTKPVAKPAAPSTPATLQPLDWSIVREEDKELLTDDIRRALIIFDKSFANARESARPSYAEFLEMLKANHYEISANELLAYKKTRLTSIGASGNIYLYDYFNCRFTKKGKGIYFQKTGGSWKLNGDVYRKDSNTLVFLGTGTAESQISPYGGKYSEVLNIYKIAPNKIIGIRVYKKSFDIYDFIK